MKKRKIMVAILFFKHECTAEKGGRHRAHPLDSPLNYGDGLDQYSHIPLRNPDSSITSNQSHFK